MWNAETYGKFEKERIQPSIDLAGRVQGTVKTILDVGCGSGMSTLCLRERFPDAEITGVDLSAEMLKKAEKLSLNAKLIQRDCSKDIEDLGTYDLVFSNAFLQWLDQQENFVKNIRKNMNPDGILAIQVPAFEQMAAAKAIKETADFCFPGRFETIHTAFNYRLEEYYDMFCRYFDKVEIWKTDYIHQFDDSDRIVEFVKGSALIPYMERLQDEEKEVFLSELKRRIKTAYPAMENGTVLFPFERIFITAHRHSNACEL